MNKALVIVLMFFGLVILVTPLANANPSPQFGASTIEFRFMIMASLDAGLTAIVAAIVAYTFKRKRKRKVEIKKNA